MARSTSTSGAATRSCWPSPSRPSSPAGTAARLQSTNLAERILARRSSGTSAEHVEHLQLWKVWHEASSFDAEIADGPSRRARPPGGAGAARHRGRRHRGPASTPRSWPTALNAMLEEFAYRWFVEGDGPGTSAADLVAASETLSTIWLSAMGLTPPTLT